MKDFCLKCLTVSGVLGWSVLLAFTSYQAHAMDGATGKHRLEHELRHKILGQNYNIHVLPPRKDDHPVRVYLGLSLIHIHELNDLREIFSVEVWLYMMWQDQRLTWKPSEFGWIDKIRVSDSTIWQPDIKLVNSAKSSQLDPWGKANAMVYYNGTIVWSPPATFHSLCEINLKMYPYDIQTCSLKFSSWTHDGDTIDLRRRNDSDWISLEHYNENNIWEIMSTSASRNVKYYACCPEPYPDVAFEVRVRRRSPYYKLTTLYPTLAVVFLTLATFWLPPMAGEKVILGCVNLVILVMMLVHLSWQLPPTGKSVPMIVWFCGNTVILVTISIVLSLISVTWSRSAHTGYAPRFLKMILSSWFGRILCVSAPIAIVKTHQTEKGMRNGEATLELGDHTLDLDGGVPDVCTKAEIITYDWIQCLTILDRIFFLVYVVVFSFVLAGAFNQ